MALPPTGAPNTRVVAIFDQYAAYLRNGNIYRHTYYSLEDVYVLYRIVRATFDDLE